MRESRLIIIFSIVLAIITTIITIPTRPIILIGIIYLSLLVSGLTSTFSMISIGVKSKDTIKIADSSGVIESTTQRANTWVIQTPQTFDRLTLLKAHESLKNDDSITDDCMVLEKYGEPVKIIPGDYTNIKLTTYEDLRVVNEFLKNNF